MASSSYVTSQPGGSSCVPFCSRSSRLKISRSPDGQAEERLRLQQEHPVVADVVDDGEPLLALAPSEAAPELLKPEDLRLRRPEHHDRVERRQVDAFVEHVDGKDDVQLAAAQLLERRGPWCGRRAGVHRHRAKTSLVEEGGHEVRVPLRNAEPERSLAPLASGTARARSPLVAGSRRPSSAPPHRIACFATGCSRSPPRPARRSSGTATSRSLRTPSTRSQR